MAITNKLPRTKGCDDEDCEWEGKLAIVKAYNFCPMCGQKL